MDAQPTKIAKSDRKLDLLTTDDFWFPVGVENSLLASPNKRGLFIASSRLSKKLDEYPRFFDALRTAATRLDPETDFLITSSSTTCDRFVKRIGWLFNLPVVQAEPLPSNPSARWKQSQIDAARASLGDSQIVFVNQKNKKDAIDDLLMSLADDVLLLSVKSNGNIARAALNRLADADTASRTRFFLDPRLTSKRMRERLQDAGVVTWCLLDDADRESGDTIATTSNEARILSLEEFQAEDFLLHWTRRCIGPWPDQTESQYLDDLIFGCERKNHREIETLYRILATRRLIATNRLTRDPRSVVCFSELALHELLERRIFRSHLNRWDFEPFGIAIEKRWLEEQGTRAVTYGDEETWKALAESDRPFFQLNKVATGKAKSDRKARPIDWSCEQEWRILGDLDLRKVPIQSAVAFVADRESADLIAPICRWPIVVLGSQRS